MIRPIRGKAEDARSLAKHLDSEGIGNRMLFGGNLTKQPVFHQLRKERPGAFRVVGTLAGADDLMERALFVGVYPGLSQRDLKKIMVTIRVWAEKKR